jgi:hypothetical protein
MLGIDTVKPHYFEPVIQDSPGSLRSITVVPVRFSYPVAYFGVFGLFINILQRYAADEKTFLAVGNGKGNRFSFFE